MSRFLLRRLLLPAACPIRRSPLPLFVLLRRFSCWRPFFGFARAFSPVIPDRVRPASPSFFPSLQWRLLSPRRFAFRPCPPVPFLHCFSHFLGVPCRVHFARSRPLFTLLFLLSSSHPFLVAGATLALCFDSACSRFLPLPRSLLPLVGVVSRSGGFPPCICSLSLWICRAFPRYSLLVSTSRGSGFSFPPCVFIGIAALIFSSLPALHCFSPLSRLYSGRGSSRDSLRSARFPLLVSFLCTRLFPGGSRPLLARSPLLLQSLLPAPLFGFPLPLLLFCVSWSGSALPSALVFPGLAASPPRRDFHF